MTKTRKVQFGYNVSGRLVGSRCSHQVAVTRERMIQLLRRRCGKAEQTYGTRGMRIYPISGSHAKELHHSQGYRYCDLTVAVVVL